EDAAQIVIVKRNGCRTTQRRARASRSVHEGNRDRRNDVRNLDQRTTRLADGAARVARDLRAKQRCIAVSKVNRGNKARAELRRIIVQEAGLASARTN